MQEQVEKKLADYLVQAISQNYFITILITSYTQAKIKTENLPFGLGKTTLALWLSFYLNKENWDTVFNQLWYNPYEVAKGLEPGTARRYAGLWDDVQATAPAMQGVAKPILRLANFLSTERPEIACLIMTAPNISSIAAPLRKLVNFEIIISERGYYEVHKITYHKRFRKPLSDLASLKYLEELAQDSPFPPLDLAQQERYDNWRINQKLQLYPSLLTDLKAYVKMQAWTGEVAEIPPILGTVIRASSGYAIKIPDELGEKLHRKQVEVAVAPSRS